LPKLSGALIILYCFLRIKWVTGILYLSFCSLYFIPLTLIVWLPNNTFFYSFFEILADFLHFCLCKEIVFIFLIDLSLTLKIFPLDLSFLLTFRCMLFIFLKLFCLIIKFRFFLSLKLNSFAMFLKDFYRLVSSSSISFSNLLYFIYCN
jgi:hypothetical protein